MIAASPNQNSFDRREPIPGYKTMELLGRGGYGEVWKAAAPGGISKAVKIIYGDADSTHAETELRALARIKDVRHPLLLSIERIEMCEGNLVIVTELADGSLKDRFVHVRQGQAAGLPQLELLRYVGDAAEALDYLYENYSLQHLDVKPENILLLSGRAKLGDFGLVKNLYERSASTIGGLTPTYAPPELFDGKPNRHSDQYSLAIVYSQMLTGVLPFPSGSTAQLAAAHLRGVPDLSALPRAQRPIIARALSKDPAQRFATCCALIESLKESLRAEEPASAHAGTQLPVPTISAQESPVAITGAFAAPTAAGARSDTTRTSNRPVASAAHPPGTTPIVLVAVGGLGVEVLNRLVDRLNDRYGPATQWPPVEIVVLDSNTRSLTSRFCEQDLDRVHVVPIPLKAADSYGAQTADILKWLGRRWFYNIPRDLTTDGYRPLGRLALVSNGPRVRAVLSQVIGRVADLAATTGRAPRITLIGGVGGGTGSGALPDLAYAIRTELKRRGLPDEQLQGVLLHSTPRSNAERDKSRANAYACLRELQHFSVPGSHYPGEPQLGALPFHGNNAAFGETLMFQLGEGLGQAEWEQAAEQTAEFLYAASFTAAENLLHPQESGAAETTAAAPLHIHRAQVIALGAGGMTTVADAVRTASQDVIRFWREGRRKPETHSASLSSLDVKSLTLAASKPTADNEAAQLDSAARQQFQHCQLDLLHLEADATEVICLESGGGIDNFLVKLVNQALDATQDKSPVSARTAAVLGILDRCLRSDFREGIDNLGDDQLFLQIVARLTSRTRNKFSTLFGWVQAQVDTPDSRIEGARRAALAIRRQLQLLHDQAQSQAQLQVQAALDIGVTTRNPDFHRPERRGIVAWARGKTADDKSQTVLNSYAGVRLKEFLYRVIAKVTRIVEAEVTTLVEQLDRLSRDLGRLASLSTEGGNSSSSPANELTHSSAIVLAYRNLLREQLLLSGYEIAENVDNLTQTQLVTKGQKLCDYLNPVADLEPVLWQPLAQAARQTVLNFIQDVNRQLLASKPNGSEGSAMQTVLQLLSSALAKTADDAVKPFVQCLVIPAGTDAGALGALSEHMAIVAGALTDITLCTIGQAATLSQLAVELTGGVALYKELGSRLQTRVDIPWRDLQETVAFSCRQAGAQYEAGTIQPTVPLPGLQPGSFALHLK